jgi:hypothetical protein
MAKCPALSRSRSIPRFEQLSFVRKSFSALGLAACFSSPADPLTDRPSQGIAECPVVLLMQTILFATIGEFV